MIEGVFNISFPVIVAVWFFWWSVTSGLINRWREEDARTGKEGCTALQCWLRELGLNDNETECLPRKIRENGLELKVDPDTVSRLLLVRTYMLVPALCAASFLIMCLLIELAISLNQFDKEVAHKVSLWFCAFALVLEIVTFVWILLVVVRFDGWRSLTKVVRP